MSAYYAYGGTDEQCSISRNSNSRKLNSNWGQRQESETFLLERLFSISSPSYLAKKRRGGGGRGRYLSFFFAKKKQLTVALSAPPPYLPLCVRSAKRDSTSCKNSKKNKNDKQKTQEQPIRKATNKKRERKGLSD